MTRRHLFYRFCVSCLRALGRGMSAFSLPAFFSRALGNGAELKREVETWRRLYEVEHAERLKLQDRLLQRQGIAAIEEVAVPQARPTMTLPTYSAWAEQDEISEIETEAMLAASDPERMQLARDAAADNPEWNKVVARATEIMNESAAVPQYGGMQ